MTNIAIQGLGEHPAPVLFLLEKEQPDISYIITSEYSYKHTDKEGGYDKPNNELVKETAKKKRHRSCLQKV